ncbi:L-saccharopine oxidase [Schizosaccharomyces cryophilus OY26]|uniref:L-saccharopine oxidase n=1 Tax=Schizosaccharomyces cryophilus (strain OY26 / ATCC MYA-4695 / CBS 11777 / NBRC 106824 / NRRL Y48691) TaxID=653667 RepID=S9X131_SCHCR|nr:L-saccharopine oxidase [Schizosaccharomyces cryophilus OY26]EPY50782.1 L-saccharopine oxidase [Schizosaccharomyces cryophilus OY26]
MTKTFLIVGCGVFGLSAAVELAKQHVFDRIIAIDAEAVPSSMSAANDLNKIVRPEYADIKYMKLALEAMDLWRTNDPVSSSYHECGRLSITSSDPNRSQFDAVSQANLRKLLGDSALINLNTPDEIRQRFPILLSNAPLKVNASAVLNEHAGYANASEALKTMESEAKKYGVEFRYGKRGSFKRFVFPNTSSGPNTLAAVETDDGSIIQADTILLAIGAYMNAYVHTDRRVIAKGLPVAHLQLTEEEYKQYTKMPIIFDPDVAYVFPPDHKSKLLKFSSTGYEYVYNTHTHYDQSIITSIPNPPSLYTEIPDYAKKNIRQFLQMYLPNLADRPLQKCKMCWISDTSDSEFLIDKLPGTENVLIANGDSGHAFKFLPNIGKYITQKVCGTLSPEWQKAWKWKDLKNQSKEVKWRGTRSLVDLKNTSFTTDN